MRLNPNLELSATRILINLKAFCQRTCLAKEQHPATRFFASGPSLLLIAVGFLGCPPIWAQGWQDLSGTHLQDSCPANNFGGQTYAFNSYCRNVIYAWSGGFADTSRNRLIVWGGGHTDYYGNEIYSLNLAANPVTLTRLNDPSPINSDPSTCPAALSDGKPNSRHTQNNMVYMPNVDKMFVLHGAVACGNGSGAKDTWTLDMASLTWQRMDPVNGYNPAGGGYAPNTWANAAYDPNTQTVLVEWNDILLQYTYSTNAYKQLNTSGHVPYAGTGVIDPKRKLFIFMGAEYESTAPHIMAIDISPGSTYAVQDWSSSVTGCDTLASANYPGLTYDSALDRIVGWPNAGNSVYLFNPDTKTCSVQTFANGPQSPPPTNLSGTFGRFQYFPALQAYGLVSSATLDAFLLRITASTGDTAPPNVSMTAPASGATVGGTVTVSANASDNVAVASVQFKLDGANLGGAVTSAPYTTSWNAATASAGSHTLTAVAVDNSGNAATSVPVTVTVNAAAAPPTISLTAPTNGASVNGTVTISANAASSVGVASVQFKLDGTNLGSAVASSPYTFSWNTSSATNGTHSLTAVVLDTAGTSVTSDGITVNVSNASTFNVSASSPNTGLGASTFTCLDRDGDHYGVGPGCLGPDADDTDPAVQTAAQGIAKYGTLSAFIAHLGQDASNQPTWPQATQLAILAGYTSPSHLYVLAPATATPAGNDSNACTLAAPCLTVAGLISRGYTNGGGDMIIMRQGWNGRLTLFGGNSSKFDVVLSYPGEQAVIDATALAGSMIDVTDNSYIVVDGAKIQRGGVMTGGTDTGSTPLNTNVLIRNMEGRDADAGHGIAPLSLFNGLSYFTVEYYVGHDDYPGGQHGLYMGSRDIPSDHVTIRRNIFFQNNWSGMHWNGRCTSCAIEQNISYSNRLSGISIQMGFQNGFVRSNLVFNNLSQAIEMSNYDGTGVATCHPQGSNATCPYDQTGNLFENNTIYSTGKDWLGEDGTSNPTGIEIGYQGVCTSVDCLATSFGNNTFRNNIIAPWGNHNNVPAFMFLDNAGVAGGCGTNCQSWAKSAVFNSNVSFQTDGLGGTGMFRFGTVYTCAAAIAASYPVTGLCSVADPKFSAANPTYWNSIASFNFGLQSSSPAIGDGSAAGVPPYDLLGYALANPPAIGAYQAQSGSSTASPCDLNSDGVVNATDVQSAVSQALGTLPCSNAALQGNGQCNVVGVQRVVVASLGGACVTGQ